MSFLRLVHGVYQAHSQSRTLWWALWIWWSWLRGPAERQRMYVYGGKTSDLVRTTDSSTGTAGWTVEVPQRFTVPDGMSFQGIPRTDNFKGIYFLLISFHRKHFLKLICLWWKHHASFPFPSSLFYKTPSIVQTHASFHPESYYDALSIESQLLRHQIKG